MDAGPSVDSGPGFDGGPAVDAGPTVDGGPIFDAGCTVAPTCDGDTLVRCVDGLTERTDCALTCMDDPAGLGCYDLDPSNIGHALADGPASGSSTIDSSQVWDTDDCDSIDGHWFVGAQASALQISARRQRRGGLFTCRRCRERFRTGIWLS